MGRLAVNAGFVENGMGDRDTARPAQCQQSFRPGGCQRGAACRYARNDLELRTLEAMTRQSKKIHPSGLRSGRVDFGSASSHLARNENLAFEHSPLRSGRVGWRGVGRPILS